MAGVGLSSSQSSQAANDSAASFGGDVFNFGSSPSTGLSAVPLWVWVAAVAVPGGLIALGLVLRYLRKRGK